MINNDDVIPGGFSLDFLPPESSYDHEACEHPEADKHRMARRILRMLMMGELEEGGQELQSWRVLHTVLIEQDDAFLRAMRHVFQEGMQHVFTQLEGQKLTPSEQEQALFFISHCLNYFPVFYSAPYEFITLPQCIQGVWERVDYHVKPIELTATEGVEKLFIADHDRVFAYGLEAISNDEADPHLIFMGTTYPTGQGFLMQIYTDFEGFNTIGTKLYTMGRARITEFLDQQVRQNKKTHVCGMSLGGALSLLLALDQGEKLSRVDALNAPGIYDDVSGHHRDRWDEIPNAQKPPVYNVKQGRDPVSGYGTWKKDWHIFHVLPPEHLRDLDPVVDHALNYVGLRDIEFIPLDPEEDNLDADRQWANFYLYAGLRNVFFCFILLPFHYVVRPLLRLALEYKVQTGLLILSCVLFPHVSILVSSALILLTAIVMLINAMDWLCETAHILCGTNDVVEPGACYAGLPRNEILDTYATETTVTLSMKELGIYHYAQHSLFSETDDTLLDGLSKQEILDESLHAGAEETYREVTASQAKVFDIKQTLRFFGGAEEDLSDTFEAQKEAFKTQHQAYLRGLSMHLNK